MRRVNLFIDFDGVIHSYSTKWKHITVIPDPPVKGAIEWLNGVIDDGRFNVSLFTARNETPEGVEATKKWLTNHGVDVEKLKFVGKKPHFDIFIDDRVLNFNGRFPSYDALHQFKPWNKRISGQPLLSDRALALLENEDIAKTLHDDVKALLEELTCLPV